MGGPAVNTAPVSKTASSHPTPNLAMNPAARPVAPPGLAAAKARCWLEEHWVRTRPWSWPMCRWTWLTMPIEIHEWSPFQFSSYGPGTAEDRGILF